jgi:DNA mismatch endonuclease (patch repair protein)
MDRFSETARSAIMRGSRSKDTKPELRVRKVAHRLGYRYRLHRKDLPGKPDLVFPSRQKVVFVHGCFWHQHDARNCTNGRVPKSNSDYWEPKLRRNVERDTEQQNRLAAMGWKVMVLWECQLTNDEVIAAKLVEFLGAPRSRGSLSTTASSESDQ